MRPIGPNIRWSLDFMHDTLSNGKTIRTLNIIDDFSREVLSIKVDANFPSSRVIRELEELIGWRGNPVAIRSDNGPEFIAKSIERWSEGRGIEWLHIQPGKPTQNSLVERFNRTFRTEILNAWSFDTLYQCRKFAGAWAYMYNNERPHSALDYLTPCEFLLKYGKQREDFPTLQQDKYCLCDWKSLILNVAI